jgi:hypothetical protein
MAERYLPSRAREAQGSAVGFQWSDMGRRWSVYGKWFLTVFGFGAAILLIVGLMTAFAALVAVAIGLLLILMAVGVLAARRTRQVGAEGSTGSEERRGTGQSAAPSASGAPRSGEGDAGAAHRARLRDGSG